jgi:uncharacterized protein
MISYGPWTRGLLPPRPLIAAFLAAFCLQPQKATADSAHALRKTIVPKPTLGYLSVPAVRNSWKSLRDERIVKQTLDFSCGAASIATLLNEYYGQRLTEEQVLEAMAVGDNGASFADMAEALPKFGFRAQGFAASWTQLTKLRIPVIVYVRYRDQEHFSVLRGISNDTVWLADPSMGNRTFSRDQFLEMWKTHTNRAHPDLSGRFLVVLPLNSNMEARHDFFTKMPTRSSKPAVDHMISTGWTE